MLWQGSEGPSNLRTDDQAERGCRGRPSRPCSRVRRRLVVLLRFNDLAVSSRTNMENSKLPKTTVPDSVGPGNYYAEPGRQMMIGRMLGKQQRENRDRRGKTENGKRGQPELTPFRKLKTEAERSRISSAFPRKVKKPY
jgi:hypothetical protein